MTLPIVRTIVVGDLMTDVVAQVDGSIRTGTDTPAAVSTHGGGAGANTAVWLASNGTPTAFIGRVGDDDLGRSAVEQLRHAGVVPFVHVDDSRPTGTCIILSFPDVKRAKLADVGANAGLQPSDLPDELFAVGRHLHLTGYPLLHERSRLAALASLDLARLRGMTTSVDPASSGPLRDVGPAMFVSWTQGVDVLFANEQEALTLSGLDTVGDAARMLAQSYRFVVIKLGPGGALCMTDDGEQITSPAQAVTLADTLGAGDAFAAGFLPVWLEGTDLSAALSAGNRLAAKAVSMDTSRP